MATAKIEGWGAGGSGAAKLSNGVNQNSAGGGGAYSRLNAFILGSGTAYTVTVGTGGLSVAGGSDNNGNNGGDTSFKDAATLLAKGGQGGVAGSGVQAGGQGGLAGSGVGDVKFSGGNAATTAGPTFSSGASSAGTASDGTNGTFNSSSNTTAPSGGGNGGAGNAGVGVSGFAPGGAGGTSSGGSASGAGADGKVIITVALGTVASATGGTHTSDASFDYWTFTSSGTWTPSIPQSYTLSLVVGAFALAGIAIGYGHSLTAAVGKFLLTGYNAILDKSPWHRSQRDTSTFSNLTKHASTFSNQAKNSGSWTDQTKH